MEKSEDEEMCWHCGDKPVVTEVLDDSRLCDECAHQWAIDNGYAPKESSADGE